MPFATSGKSARFSNDKDTLAGLGATTSDKGKLLRISGLRKRRFPGLGKYLKIKARGRAKLHLRRFETSQM